MYGHHFTNVVVLLGNQCHKFLRIHSVSQQEAQAYCISQGMLHTRYSLQDRAGQTFGQPLTPAEGGSGVLTGPLHCQTSRRAGWVPKTTVQPQHLRQGWRGHDHRTEGVL